MVSINQKTFVSSGFFRVLQAVPLLQRYTYVITRRDPPIEVSINR
jgi:hypothetical protein